MEHGIRGNVQAGLSYETQPDPETGIPVYAVYGGEESLIESGVPAIIAAEGGYTISLVTPIPAEAVTPRVFTMACTTRKETPTRKS